MSEEYTRAQNKVIADVNNRLKKVGLCAYSELENRLYIALTSAYESVMLGKQLVKKLTEAENALNEVRKDRKEDENDSDDEYYWPEDMKGVQENDRPEDVVPEPKEDEKGIYSGEEGLLDGLTTLAKM